MGKASSVVLKHPWITISIIAIITVGAILEITLNPMEESFQQEDFLPDMEVASAWNDYEEIYTSDYGFSGLIKDPDGDLVTVEDFKTMVNLTMRIRESETFLRWKEDNVNTDNPSAPPVSLHSMRAAADSAEDIIGIGEQASELIVPTDEIGSMASSVIDNITYGNHSDTDHFAEVFSNLSRTLDNYFGVSEDDFGEQRSTPDMVSYYEGFGSDQELKDEIDYLISYNVTSSEVYNGTSFSMQFSGKARSTVETLADASDGLHGLLDKENFTANVSLEEDIRELIDEVDDVIEDMEEKSFLAGSIAAPIQISRLAKSYFAASFTFNMFLTKDFDPASGVFKAEGSLYMVSLNYTLNNLAETDLDKVIEIEQNLTDIFDEVDDETDMDITALGSQIISKEIFDASTESMRILLPLAVLLVIIILSIIYRNVLDVLMNLVSLLLAIIWMYGFGSLMGFSSNPMITAVPVLLVGLGIDYGIHITMRYREEIKKGNSVKDSLNAMAGSVGMALLLATFTTVLAFLSNLASQISLIMQFGVLAAVGILSSFVIMLTFVPAVKRIRDVRRAEKGKTLWSKVKEGDVDDENSKKSAGIKTMNTAFAWLATISERHPVIIIAITLIISSGMGVAASRNRMTFDVNDFLPEDMEITRDFNYLMDNFDLGGGGGMGLVLVSGEISDPEVLTEMHQVIVDAGELDSDYFVKDENTGIPEADFVLFSLNEIALSSPYGNFSTLYSKYFDSETLLPKPDTTAEEIESVLNVYYDSYRSQALRVIHREDGEFDRALISFTTSTDSDEEAFELYDQLEDVSAPLYDIENGSVDDVRVTGSTILGAVISETITQSQVRSLLITMIVSLVVLTLVFFLERRRLLLGLVAVLPMAFCVLWVLGAMYLLGIPLNVMTVTIGSLTVGLGITYGIHITHRFVEDIEEYDDIETATRKTILNTGSALFGAATTTVAGFGLLVFSLMPPLKQFGQVTALAIIFSFLASILVLPALLVIWEKSSRWVEKKRSKD